MLAQRVVHIELALLGEHQDPQAGELLAATRQVKDRVLRNGHVSAQVGQAIAGRMHDGPGLDDGEREPRIIGAHPARDIMVDLRRALRFDTDALRRRLGAVPKVPKKAMLSGSGILCLDGRSAEI